MASRFSIFQATALSDTRLTPRDITVLAALGTYADKKGLCSPAVSSIAATLGVSRQAVQRSLRTLCDCRYIAKKRRISKNGGDTSNIYKISLDYSPQMEFLRDKKEAEPLQPPVAGGVQPPVAGGATSEVAGGATSEVAPIPLNDPYERKKSGRAVAVTSSVTKNATERENDIESRTGTAKLLAAYHHHCPSGKKIKIQFADNHPTLHTKMLAAVKSRPLDEWERVFAIAEKSDFLTGRTPGADGEMFNGLTIGWLLTDGVADRILAGRYSANDKQTKRNRVSRDGFADLEYEEVI